MCDLSLTSEPLLQHLEGPQENSHRGSLCKTLQGSWCTQKYPFPPDARQPGDIGSFFDWGAAPLPSLRRWEPGAVVCHGRVL